MADGWTVPGFTHMKELGRGASGRVVLAVDDVTQTPVAIKYLDARLLGDERFLARFRVESKRLSQLEDPNVVDLYEFVEEAGGAAIVMERIEGISLERVLAAQGPTGPLAALAVLSGSLLGLAAADGAGIVHRDLKPANILVDAQGHSKLTDFGISVFHDAPAAPGYVAPEMWEGAPPSPAAEMYAATIVFFECLTGSRPFHGKNLGALARAHRDQPIPVEAVPGPLRGLIAQGLAKEPADRPASAADFLASVEDAAVAAYGIAWEVQGRGRLAELATMAAAAPPPARSAAPPPADPVEPGGGRRERGKGRGRAVLVSALGLVLVAGGIGGAAVYAQGQDDDPPKDRVGNRQSVAPTPTPTRQAPGRVSGPALAKRITRATGRERTASFAFRRRACCGDATTARGLLQATRGATSYDMTVSNPGGAYRRPTRTLLVGNTAYVRGPGWRTAPVAEVKGVPRGDQTRGYAALAAHTRWGTTVQHMVALLESSGPLRRSGRTYTGAATLAKLARGSAVAPLYAELRTGSADRVSFVIEVDARYLPRRVRVTVTPTGESGRRQVLETTYRMWGRDANVTPPPGAAAG